MLDSAVDLLALSGLSTGLLHRVTVSDGWWLMDTLLSDGTLPSHGLLDCMLTSDRLLVALLSDDTLTGDGLLLTTRGESLFLDGSCTSGTGGTSWADGGGGIVVTVVVTGNTSGCGTGSTSLGLGGEGSELALSLDAVVVLLRFVRTGF